MARCPKGQECYLAPAVTLSACSTAVSDLWTAPNASLAVKIAYQVRRDWVIENGMNLLGNETHRLYSSFRLFPLVRVTPKTFSSFQFLPCRPAPRLLRPGI